MNYKLDKRFINCTLLLLLFGIACGNKNNTVLQIPDMKFVMWDMVMADNLFGQMAIKDSLARPQKKNIALYQKVFEHNNTTREQFYNSYKYYQMHPLEMKILFDSVEAYGARVKVQYEKKPHIPVGGKGVR
ncbi:DUF4296 domain-containing protein [Parasediminibacterium sp. JCM 36343]|uniref:DUF4296 domain-containing protein n=1 Tax=Parasediminibacterium sp. JCM 36343 TaxID=3374279 RepID=UPI003978C118